jgi:hypothetical protein
METRIYATGAEPSTIDLRDFTYKPDKAALTAPQKGGERYQAEDIEDQSRVGICTAISVTMNARKALGKKFNADFQYLIQKKFFDKNWNEGSSARSALHSTYTYGLLPEEEWTHTTQADRKLSYSKYIAKLKAIPESEIARLLAIAARHKYLTGYAQVPVDRDKMFSAIDESQAGLIVRYNVGREWYTAPIEPLRAPLSIISGHLITMCNYDGMSYRLANSWGDDWADKGTAFSNLRSYQPTEAWIPYYASLPPAIEDQKKQLESLYGQMLALLQKMVALLDLKK